MGISAHLVVAGSVEEGSPHLVVTMYLSHPHLFVTMTKLNRMTHGHIFCSLSDIHGRRFVNRNEEMCPELTAYFLVLCVMRTFSEM